MQPNLGRPAMASAAQPLRDAGRHPPANWSALMARAQDGDAWAYRAVLESVTPYVRAIASRAHRNPSDAEDTVQDVLLTLHAVRHTYDRARPFKPWLAGIARHRVADRMRVLGRALTREVALDPWHEGLADEAPAGPALLDPSVLQAALDALPPGQRRAVTLLKLRELSLKDAAAQSGMTVGSLKVAMHRAMRMLRTALAGTDKQP